MNADYSVLVEWHYYRLEIEINAFILTGINFDQLLGDRQEDGGA